MDDVIDDVMWSRNRHYILLTPNQLRAWKRGGNTKRSLSSFRPGQDENFPAYCVVRFTQHQSNFKPAVRNRRRTKLGTATVLQRISIFCMSSKSGIKYYKSAFTEHFGVVLEKSETDKFRPRCVGNDAAAY